MLICYSNYDNERGVLCILDTKTMKFRLMKRIDALQLIMQGHIIGGLVVDGTRWGISQGGRVPDLDGRMCWCVPLERSLDVEYIEDKLQIILGDMEYINLDISPNDIEKMTMFRVFWATYIDCSCESCLLVYTVIGNFITQYTVRYEEDKWVVCDALEVDLSK